MELHGFIMALLSDMVSLMSGLASVVLTLIGIFKKWQNIPSKAYWIVALVCFFVSSVRIWTIEHRAKLEAEARLTQLTVPNLAGKIEFVSLSPVTLMNKPCVLVTLFVNITNVGAPSIADVKSIKVILKNGKELELETVTVPLGGIQLKPVEPGGLTPRLPSQDYLPIKALNQAIPTGGAALGWTWGLARGISFTDINDPASKIVLPFADVKGKLYEAKGTLADAKVQAVDSNLLQQ